MTTNSTSTRRLGSWWLGASLGLLVTIGLLLILDALGSEFITTAFDDSTGHLVAAILLILTGVGVYLVCLASRFNPMIAAMPAGALAALSAPLTLGLGFPDLYPGWLSDMVLSSYNLHTPVIIGVLGAATLWSTWECRRDGNSSISTELSSLGHSA